MILTTLLVKLLEIKEDENGLWIDSRISDSEIELKTKIREEIYNELSIPYVVVKCTMEQKGGKMELCKTYLRG